jgi:cytochrome c-type biogenesis protein CcmF
MAVAPLVKWRTDTFSRIGRTLLILAGLAVAAVLATILLGKTFLGAIGIGLAVWLIGGTLVSYGRKLRIGEAKSAIGNLPKRFAILPGATHGFALAHLGMAVTTIGIVSMGVWSDENVDRIKLGESVSVAGYEFILKDVTSHQGDNYSAETGKIVIENNGRIVGQLNPEQRTYPVERNNTTEGAMEISLLRILYAAKGEGTPEDGWIVRVYYHPMVSWIWIGAFMMAFGGFFSLADRRFGFVTKPKVTRVPACIPAE